MTAAYAPDLVAEAKQPRGEGALVAPARTARASNPTCGDDIELDVDHDGVLVRDVAHRTRGCAFTRASASLLARSVPGTTLAEARDLAATLRRDLAGSAALPEALRSLASVRIYPARIRCALLPWDALVTALEEA